MPKEIQCAVVVAGGTTAALAAAVSSAEQGLDTCLIEPTDWLGGQLTASGVPAIDWANHTSGMRASVNKGPKINLSEAGGAPANQAKHFKEWLATVGYPSKNPGHCDVSKLCFEPLKLLPALDAAVVKAKHLRVFREAVIKNVETGDRKIVAITAIARHSVQPGHGYDARLSDSIDDWYSENNSNRFKKEILHFTGINRTAPVVIEATEWGEVLALSGTDFVEGPEQNETDRLYEPADDRCGQATIFPFVAKSTGAAKPSIPAEIKSVIKIAPESIKYQPNWNYDWIYRRISDIFSLQNAPEGQDYLDGYLFKSVMDTREEADRDWRGGVDKGTLRAAEDQSLAWFNYFRTSKEHKFEMEIAATALGTKLGLSKVPYVRDTRRGYGLDRFVMTYGSVDKIDSGIRWGTHYKDTIAIGAYLADVHPVFSEGRMCIPEYVDRVGREPRPEPFYIPFRALTLNDFDNTLVTGKTMSQTFLANAATRLHPIEFNTGVAAGVAAAYMAKNNATSRQALANVQIIQKQIALVAPLEWTH